MQMNGQLRKTDFIMQTCLIVRVCARVSVTWTIFVNLFCKRAFLRFKIQDGDLDDFMKIKPCLYCRPSNCPCRLELTLAYQYNWSMTVSEQLHFVKVYKNRSWSRPPQVSHLAHASFEVDAFGRKFILDVELNQWVYSILFVCVLGWVLLLLFIRGAFSLANMMHETFILKVENYQKYCLFL